MSEKLSTWGDFKNKFNASTNKPTNKYPTKDEVLSEISTAKWGGASNYAGNRLVSVTMFSYREVINFDTSQSVSLVRTLDPLTLSCNFYIVNGSGHSINSYRVRAEYEVRTSMGDYYSRTAATDMFSVPIGSNLFTLQLEAARTGTNNTFTIYLHLEKFVGSWGLIQTISEEINMFIPRPL